MKVEKKEFLIDGRKSAMMTMRRQPLADRSRLEMRQPERHGNIKGPLHTLNQMVNQMVNHSLSC